MRTRCFVGCRICPEWGRLLILLYLAFSASAVRAQFAGPAAAARDVRVSTPAPLPTKGESGEQRVERLLEARVDVVFRGTLGEGLAELGRALGVEIAVDRESLEEIGVELGAPVVWDLRGCRAREAVELLLRDCDLAGVVVDGRILVLSLEDQEQATTNEALDVSALLDAAGSNTLRERFLQSLPDVITATVQPTQWERYGGRCRFEPSSASQSRFVLTASAGVRRDVKALLGALEQAAKAQTPVSLFPFAEEKAAALQAMARPVTLDFRDAPLPDAMREIGRQIQMSINLDRRGLDDMGIGLDSPITFQCRGLRASDALARILDRHELTWMCLGGGLLVTTFEEYESRLTTAVFDIHDIVFVGDEVRDVDSPVEAISTVIAPSSWNQVGGPGSIAPICLKDHTFLVVSQTQEVLWNIQSILERIRKSRKEGQAVLRERNEEQAALAKALDRQMAWHFDNVPLEEAVSVIARTLGVDAFLDRRSLDDMGIGTDSPVSLPAGRYVARDALKQMLDPLDSTIVIAHGGVMITTEETAESRMETAVYAVDDLIHRDNQWADYECLIECITTAIEATAWDQVGGPGLIAVFETEDSGLLVVSQTQPILHQLTQFFDILREVRKTPAQSWVLESKTDAAVRKALEKRIAWSFSQTPLPEAAAKIAADLGVQVRIDRSAFDDMGIDPDRTRVSLPYLYFPAREALGRMLVPAELSFTIGDGALVITTEENAANRFKVAVHHITGMVAAGTATPDGLVEAIYRTVAPETWDAEGGPGCASVLDLSGDRKVLVVAHEERVLHEVEKRLDGVRRK